MQNQNPSTPNQFVVMTNETIEFAFQAGQEAFIEAFSLGKHERTDAEIAAAALRDINKEMTNPAPYAEPSPIWIIGYVAGYTEAYLQWQKLMG